MAATKARKPAGPRSPHGWIEEPSPPQAWSQVPPQAPPPAYGTPPGAFDERQYVLFLHLSALAGLFVGGLFFLGPLILWLVKKDQSAYVDRNGRSAMDFQLSLLIFAVLAVMLLGAIAVVTLGIGVLLLLPVILLATLGFIAVAIIFPIIAAVKASQGQVYDYPLSLRLLRRPAGLMR